MDKYRLHQSWFLNDAESWKTQKKFLKKGERGAKSVLPLQTDSDTTHQTSLNILN